MKYSTTQKGTLRFHKVSQHTPEKGRKKIIIIKNSLSSAVASIKGRTHDKHTAHTTSITHFHGINY
jgi:hypothetical protein